MIFTIRDDYSEDIYNLLLSYSDYISFSYCGISAGEKKILDVFSGVFSHVNIFDKNNRNDEKTNIILLDGQIKGYIQKCQGDLSVGWLKYLIMKKE